MGGARQVGLWFHPDVTPPDIAEHAASIALMLPMAVFENHWRSKESSAEALDKLTRVIC